jgi:hypothetical protein
VNAAEQATNVELASKIATVVNCFKQTFPDAHADLKPWANDPDTLATVDPESIDIGFHLPGWSPRYQCRSILVQLRCHGGAGDRQLLGLDVVGLSYHGEQWRLSTVGTWDCVGEKPPVTEIKDAIRVFCRNVFELFRARNQEAG